MTELFESLKLLEPYSLGLVVVGLGVLGLAALLNRLRSVPFSFPVLALTLGYVAFALPLGLTAPAPEKHGALILHVTEIGVIISLMGVGLKIDRLPHWRTWSPTWRLLLICMPLSIAGVAILGWWMLGIAPAAAILLGAALAPTDPVLASDVQVGEPEGQATQGEHDKEEDATATSQKVNPIEREDELRFTLTSEAGLNDSLAFPFTYLALLMLTEGVAPANWLELWLLRDVAYRMVVGVALGVILGWLLSHVLLRLPVDSEREKMQAGVGALAGTLLIYGITECLCGYGFLAVFIGGLTIRHRESHQQSHQSLHTFAEQSEQLLMTVILVALGGAIAGGLLASLTWQAVLLSLLLIFFIRPVAGLIGLIGERRLPWLDRAIVSFFGIRGIGCLFYLAYGMQNGTFAEHSLLWSVCGFTAVVSIFIHGVSAAPVMRYRDRQIHGHATK